MSTQAKLRYDCRPSRQKAFEVALGPHLNARGRAVRIVLLDPGHRICRKTTASRDDQYIDPWMGPKRHLLLGRRDLGEAHATARPVLALDDDAKADGARQLVLITRVTERSRPYPALSFASATPHSHSLECR